MTVGGRGQGAPPTTGGIPIAPLTHTSRITCTQQGDQGLPKPLDLRRVRASLTAGFQLAKTIKLLEQLVDGLDEVPGQRRQLVLAGVELVLAHDSRP